MTPTSASPVRYLPCSLRGPFVAIYASFPQQRIAIQHSIGLAISLWLDNSFWSLRLLSSFTNHAFVAVLFLWFTVLLVLQCVARQITLGLPLWGPTEGNPGILSLFSFGYGVDRLLFSFTFQIIIRFFNWVLWPGQTQQLSPTAASPSRCMLGKE